MLYIVRIVIISIVCLSTTSFAASLVHEFKLDNGLLLIVKEDHRAPVVVNQVWYKVGASYEQSGKTGLSHLLEHMMFKGTQKHPVGEFSRLMSINGAQDNAFTTTDYTAYFQTLEKSRLPVSFELEADRMRNLNLQEAEFTKERQVVLEERRTRTEDEPSSVLFEHFRATAYRTSPYHNPTIGWMRDIEQLTLADLQDWYTRWYAPNNAVVVVVGDVNPEEVLTLAKQYFGNFKEVAITPVPSRPEIPQFGMQRIIVKRPAKIPSLLMGYKVPTLKTIAKEDTWEVYALSVLDEVLSGGNSSRLSKNLVRGQELASDASTGYDATSLLSELFMFSAVPTKDHTIAQLEEALRGQIKQVQTALVDKAELERVKTQLKAYLVYEQDSLFYQGMKIGSLAAVGLDWHLWDSYLDNVVAVTPEQVQQVAQKYLVDDSLTVAILDPQSLPEGKEMSQESPSAEIHKTQGEIR
jgi:zinc protease